MPDPGGTTKVNTAFECDLRCYSDDNSAALAWRPAHSATAENVNMEVVDRLAAIRACVDDEAVAAVEVVRAGNHSRLRQERAEQGGVLRQGVRV